MSVRGEDADCDSSRTESLRTYKDLPGAVQTKKLDPTGHTLKQCGTAFQAPLLAQGRPVLCPWGFVDVFTLTQPRQWY